MDYSHVSNWHLLHLHVGMLIVPTALQRARRSAPLICQLSLFTPRLCGHTSGTWVVGSLPGKRAPISPHGTPPAEMAFPKPGKHLLAGARFSGLWSDALCCESECFTVPKGESLSLSPLGIVHWVAYYDRDLTCF